MPAKGIKPRDPVSSQDIYQALCGAASQDAAIVKASSETLQDYMKCPGTYHQLHAVAAEKNNVPLDVRRVAIILFKNGALTVWKNKKLFTDEGRVNIRARSMTFLHEEDNIIADCNALIIGKIARIDFPTAWPFLITDLTTALQVEIQNFLSDPKGTSPAKSLFLKRSLTVLDVVIKEFCSIKLPQGMRTMAQLADALYSPLIAHYDRLAGLLRTSLTPEALLDPQFKIVCEELLEVSHLVFKPCVKTILWLWQRSSQKDFRVILQGVQKDFDGVSETLSVFAQSCFSLARGFFDLRMQLVLALRRNTSGRAASSSTPALAIPVPAVKCLHLLTRHLRLYGKMFKRMQQLNPRGFIILPQAKQLVQYYWGEVVKATSGPPEFISDAPDAVYPIRLLVQAMVLFRESLAPWSDNEKSENGVDTLPGQYVQEAVQILLTRFIPLTPSDLQKWMIDPEDWVNEEEREGDAWEFDLRPCSERVLVTLCARYPAYVIPLLLKSLEEILASRTENLADIIQKEAIYCAIGRCAHQLQDQLDFDDWLQKHLIVEARESNPDYRIIKRRIAWVIGKWHSGQCKLRLKTLVWEVLHHLMHDQGPSSDPVVRLSAAEALRECVDTLEFELQSFVPFLHGFVTEVLRLILEADTMEGKNRLIKTLNVVIECAGINIVPFMDVITSPLPRFWKDAGDEYILKASLISTMTHLVQAAKEHSASLSHMVISLVRESLDPKTKLHLDQDGFILWQAALRNAVALASPRADTPSYIDMCPHATVLVAENLDLLGTVLSIVQSYILLDGPKVIANYGQELFRAFATAISRAVQTNVKDVLFTIQLITQTVPPLHYVEAMHSSGLFALLVKSVIEDKGSLASPALLLAEHVYIFARIALWDPSVFNQLIVASSPLLNMPETQVFEGVLDQWWSKFDNMAEPRHRKLAAMGIAGWVSTSRPEVLDRLHTEIFSIWLDVFAELKEALEEGSVEGTPSPLKMFWLNSAEEPSPMPDAAQGTLEEDRWRQVHLGDPITSQKLTVFVKERLQQAEVNCGGGDVLRAKYLDKADSTMLGQLMVQLKSGN